MSKQELEFINQIKKEDLMSLTAEKVLKICKRQANVVLYPDLLYYDNIDDVLGIYGACIILYQTSPSYGHWVCIFKLNKNTVEHFDSYSYKPDKELKFIDKDFRKKNNENFPYLTYLLYKSGYKINYNEHHFQSNKREISTCGRWTGARLLLRHLTLKQFYNKFKPFKEFNSDFIVTLFTRNLI
jgi:hypothetical protein